MRLVAGVSALEAVGWASAEMVKNAPASPQASRRAVWTDFIRSPEMVSGRNGDERDPGERCLPRVPVHSRLLDVQMTGHSAVPPWLAGGAAEFWLVLVELGCVPQPDSEGSMWRLSRPL